MVAAPQLLAARVRGPEFTSEIRCVPDGSGTRLEMEIHVRPRTFGAKLLSPLIALTSKIMVKSCAKDLVDIAAAAEHGGDARCVPGGRTWAG